MKSLVITSLVLLAVSGCKTIVEPLITTRQAVRNEFSQRVALEVYNNGSQTEAFQLDTGEEKYFSYTTDGPIPPNFNFADSVRFTFADGRSKVDIANVVLDSANILDDSQHLAVGETYWYYIDSVDYQDSN